MDQLSIMGPYANDRCHDGNNSYVPSRILFLIDLFDVDDVIFYVNVLVLCDAFLLVPLLIDLWLVNRYNGKYSIYLDLLVLSKYQLF